NSPTMILESKGKGVSHFNVSGVKISYPSGNVVVLLNVFASDQTETRGSKNAMIKGFNSFISIICLKQSNGLIFIFLINNRIKNYPCPYGNNMWHDYILDFKRYLAFERNLSDNTVQAYLNDIRKLREYAEERSLATSDLTAQDIQDFLTWMNTFHISPFTQARLLSGIKVFFTFMQLEHQIPYNPAELIESPRLPRTLPDVLTIVEIDEL